MAEIIIGSIAVILIAALLVINVSLRLNIARLAAEKLQVSSDTDVMLEQLNKLKEELETIKLQETDGFVRFLSESREWAFNYIDDVQLSIVSLKNAMDKGDSQQVLEAFNQLVSFLPDEERNKEK